MRNKFARQGSYIHGCPTGSDGGWLSMVMDDVAVKGIKHSAFMKMERSVLTPRFMKMFPTVFAGQLADGTVVFVGGNGQAISSSPDGQTTEERVASGADSPETIGDLRSAAIVGSRLIAVGMQRQVYVRAEDGTWSASRAGLPAFGEGETSGFEAVAAVSAAEIYAAGWDGELWRFDGASWNPIASPTKSIITALCVDDAGLVHGCGRNGLLLSGRADAWRVVSDPRCPDDLWSMAAHGARVFAASRRSLYCIEDGALSVVELSSTGAGSFGVLSANGRHLWSIGDKDVLSYDGASWSAIA